jgi:hypothetical protein
MQVWNKMAVALGAALLVPLNVQAGVQAGERADVLALDSLALAQLEDAAHEDRLEPLALELAGVGEARFELSLGATATRRGFALDIAGGRPFGWALVTFEDGDENADGVAGSPARELVRLDAQGAARLVRRDWRGRRDVRALLQMPRPSGVRALLSATIPAAATIPPPQVSSLAAPTVVITEIMKDPTAVADSLGEWFEVRNLTGQAIDLTGWTLTDGASNTHVILPTVGTVWIPARSYFVFGINSNTAQNGGVLVDYRYSSFTLANGADSIQLLDASGTLVDAVSYDDGIFWPDTAGKTLSLDRALVDPSANDDGGNWCNGAAPMGPTGTDFGTPRRANLVCP